ncbi:MAG: hypothetical protein KA397_01825 [Paludibacteraceae bacterium]|nr:hypothetical protein [Paludibacteraceae bacterium]MBP6284284.1 hypothetical protein [Paludibacteraceae bacterium]
MKNCFLIVSYIAIFFVLQMPIQLFAQKRTTVFLESAETLSFDQTTRSNAQLLKGNVRFRHENVVMYCDSAYFYEKNNSLDAFGNVKIVQGDTLFIYGDKLFYDGNARLAQLRNNVRMVNRNSVLTTQKLDYDTYQSIGYYYDNGTLTDKTNILSSQKGEYITKQNLMKFKKNVTLTNPEFVLYSDTLHYHTNTTVATLVGPSNIISDSTTIYAEKGWYHTSTENAKLTKKASITQKNGRRIVGDSILYNKKNAIAEAFSHVVLSDSAQQISVTGNYAKYFEKKEKGFFTQYATFREHGSSDTLFLSADTLFYASINNSYAIKAYHGVRFWQTDMQGVCDSLTYSESDSLLTMHANPILWNNNNQITGSVIHVNMANEKVDNFVVDENAFMLSEEDKETFNQLSGRKIIGHILNGKLKKIEVIGNAQSIYYVKDGNNAVGTNRAESAFLTIYLNKKNKAEKIVMSPQSGGILYPPSQKDATIVKFNSFKQYKENRPKNQFDIYKK